MSNTATETFTREQAKAADYELYQAMLNVARKESAVASALNSIHYSAGDDHRRKYDARSGWKLTDVEAQDKLVEMIETTQFPFRAQEWQADLDKLVQAQNELVEAREARKAADKWKSHGKWNRFSVVPGGHIHTDLHCFTFRLTTDVRWAYPVSGDTVDEAIETYGEALCTHCFPNAPVAQTTAKIGVNADGSPQTKAEAAAIADAKNAAKAAKMANAVLDGEGKVMYKTERGATNAVASELDSALWYGPSHPSYNRWIALVDKIVEALAIKRGVEFAVLRAELVAKAEKKAKKSLAS